MKRSLSCWFSAQQLLDLAQILLVLNDSPFLRKRLMDEYGFTVDSLDEIAMKLAKEIDRLG